MRTALAQIAMLLAIFASGCSGPAPCHVNGTILVNNKPTEGVYVVVHAPNGETAGSGRSSSDGSFRLSVKQAGDYRVTCFFPQVTKFGDDTFEGDDQFKGRYRNVQQPVTTATVKAGDNSLQPIQLTR